MEEKSCDDNCFVHVNWQPGVTDAALDQNTSQFQRQLYRKTVPHTPPASGVMLINLALSQSPLGDRILSGEEFAFYVAAFEETWLTGSIDWYLDKGRNWEILADVNPIIYQPALMIYGDHDMIPNIGKHDGFRTKRGRCKS